MRAHSLIAILPDGTAAMPPEGLVWHDVDRMTAVVTRAPSPLMRLPVDRRTRLIAAADYQRMLESLRPYGTVIPVRQNTDLQARHLPTLLRANGPLLCDLAASLLGFDQYQISVAWDGAGVLQRFRDDPEIFGLFEAAQISAQDLSDAITKLRNRLSRTITEELTALSTDLIALPCDAETLVNLVLLTPTSAAHKLETALESVDAIWTEGFRIRQIGPAAPASFATLEPRWIARGMIEASFATLYLPINASADRISAARKEILRHARLPKDEVDAAVRIASAALNARTGSGFHLCDIWRDGTAQTQAVRKDAA